MAEIKRILLADDDPNDVELALTALANHNLANEVMVARDGEETLDILLRRGEYAELEGGNPAVILLDLKMPKVDGLDVLRRIRAEEQLKLLPVIVLTSSRQDRDIIDAYALGVNAYVVKPVSFDHLADVVSQTGLFWAVINEPPPGTLARSAREKPVGKD